MSGKGSKLGWMEKFLAVWVVICIAIKGEDGYILSDPSIGRLAYVFSTFHTERFIAGKRSEFFHP
jgi:hypothetical protein